MPKVIVDENMCIGCGLCASTCPEVFVMKDGHSHVIAQSCPKGHDLKEIAVNCPGQAIEVTDEEE